MLYKSTFNLLTYFMWGRAFGWNCCSIPKKAIFDPLNGSEQCWLKNVERQFCSVKLLNLILLKKVFEILLKDWLYNLILILLAIFVIVHMQNVVLWHQVENSSWINNMTAKISSRLLGFFSLESNLAIRFSSLCWYRQMLSDGFKRTLSNGIWRSVTDRISVHLRVM